MDKPSKLAAINGLRVVALGGIRAPGDSKTAEAIETLRAECGQAAVSWALTRSMASPYSARYWLAQARARKGLGYGDA